MLCHAGGLPIRQTAYVAWSRAPINGRAGAPTSPICHACPDACECPQDVILADGARDGADDPVDLLLVDLVGERLHEGGRVLQILRSRSEDLHHEQVRSRGHGDGRSSDTQLLGSFDEDLFEARTAQNDVRLRRAT